MPLKVNLPVKTPNLIKRLYCGYVWDKKDVESTEKTLYLTFDDGPIPEITPWVLETLKPYNAKATFFCIGENILKNPEIFNFLKNSKHGIGNHTYNHLNGWKTDTKSYIENFKKADEILNPHISKSLKLFRPPYGKIKKHQGKIIKQSGYEIIMYDVLAYDWEHSMSKEKCLENVISNAEDGSIVVFHDSLKAEKNMKFALPRVLEYFSELGYTFKAL